MRFRILSNPEPLLEIDWQASVTTREDCNTQVDTVYRVDNQFPSA